MRYLLTQIYITILLVANTALYAQTETPLPPYQLPLRITPSLSGNFGEIRNNHFHSGLDFRTGGRVGIPVYCVGEGFVSRIGVSEKGYGNALYIDHPEGFTSVYGHLKEFSPKIDSIVKAYQYAHERFDVQIYLQPHQCPISKGERIALSGNSGSSGGPHLHFELRHTVSEWVVNPISIYRTYIPDTRKPTIEQLLLYSQGGVIAGSCTTKFFTPTTDKVGNLTIATPIKAWGKISIGVRAYDNIDNMNGRFGIKILQVLLDQQRIFRWDIDQFSFDDSRYLNSFIDYRRWKEQHTRIMECRIEPGCYLPLYKNEKSQGIIDIVQERNYAVTLTVIDGHGNPRQLNFTLQGVKQPLPSNTPPLQHKQLVYNRPHTLSEKGVKIVIPDSTLYTTIPYEYAKLPAIIGAATPTHRIGNTIYPLHKPISLSLKIEKPTTQVEKYYIAQIKQNKKVSNSKPPQCTYQGEWCQAEIKEWGDYALFCDTTAPTIAPLNDQKWLSNNTIQFTIKENESGIDSYKGTVDGAYALFTNDIKSPTVYSYRIDKKRHKSKCNHLINMEATDKCGNKRKIAKTIYW